MSQWLRSSSTKSKNIKRKFHNFHNNCQCTEGTMMSLTDPNNYQCKCKNTISNNRSCLKKIMNFWKESYKIINNFAKSIWRMQRNISCWKNKLNRTRRFFKKQVYDTKYEVFSKINKLRHKLYKDKKLYFNLNDVNIFV